MKIALFIDSLHVSGGMERVTIEIANSLVQRAGMEVDIITIHGGEPFFDLDDRIKVFALVPHKRWSRVMRHYAGYVCRLRRVLKRGRYDCVITSDTLLSVFSIPAAWGLGVRVVSWEHNNANVNWGRIAYPISRFVASHFADRIVVLTDADKTTFKRKYGARNATRIVNPVTIDTDGEVSLLTDKRFLSVGRLSYEKGLDMMLDAWAATSCRSDGWSLRIVGSGGMEGELREQTVRLGIEDSVEMIPAVKDVRMFYREASCFVLSSRFEGFGLVLTEAASMGLPAISFDCECGPRGIILDGETGLLVPPEDVPALAAAMDELAADGARRARMGAAAIERSKLFAPDVITAQWVELLNGLYSTSKSKTK